MLSIRALGSLGNESSAARAVSSYFKDAYADYYVKDLDNNFVGEWCGKGAGLMGLQGSIDKDSLTAALSGRAGNKEVKNAGSADRYMGWDMTFSAPKSVSLAWAFGNEVHKKEIEQAHLIAARRAFEFIEKKITTRLGQGGKIKQNALIAAASFLHFTSREGDPQLHSHYVIPNLSISVDGKLRTMVSKEFYTHKMVVGALYQAELCLQIKKLGYAVEAGVKGTFRLASVNKMIERSFSKRAEEINLVAAKLGADFYVAQRGVVLLTRPSKKYSTLEERLNVWQGEIKSLGINTNFKRNRLQNSLVADDQPSDDKINHSALFKKIQESLTEKYSYFQEKDILLEIARAYQGTADINGIKKVHTAFMLKSGVVALGINKSKQIIYTTLEMKELEEDLLRMASKLNKRKFQEGDIKKAGATFEILNDEQRLAVKTAINKHGLVIIEGKAGTGKTVIFDQVRDIYEKSGQKIEGICFTGRAANELQNNSKIGTKTIHSWLAQKEFSKNSILVIDEAGLIGSKQLSKILNLADENNNKVIIVGDPKQLQPIDAGGPLHMIDKKLAKENSECSSLLVNVMRQKKEWMKEAVIQASVGAVNKSLEAYYNNKKIEFYRTPKQARKKLVQDYISENIADEQASKKTAVIMTNRISDASMINKEIREQLKEKGVVKEKGIIFESPDRIIEISIGDKIMFTKNDYSESLQVRNGQVGQVTKLNEAEKTFTIEMEDGLKKSVDTTKYNHLDYGWAMTTYKSQGTTVDQAYVYGYSKDPSASQQSTYVQISRAKEETKLYIIGGAVSVELPIREYESPFTEEENKKLLKSIGKSWGRDATKLTSVDIVSRLRSIEPFQGWYIQEEADNSPNINPRASSYN